ncbi:MAG: alpha/beta hydrolase [bacterium]|nr:alpha/beta hydrolase [bacterium]
MKFSETKCEIFQADEKTKLLTHIWLPEKKVSAVFIAIHGGLTHGGDYITSGLYFAKKGVATYAPDLRYHGTFAEHNENEKIFFHIDSYDTYSKDIHKFYDWVKEKHPGVPIFMYGHSNGSLISLNYGLTMGKNTDVKGYIISSPWLKNVVKVPLILRFLSKIVAAIVPKFESEPEPLNDVVTHDKEITARHYEDEKNGLRGKTASAKLFVEATKTQQFVVDNIKNWEKFPIFAVVAGQDKLADPETSKQALNSISSGLVEMHVHENNYHENYNEENRKETFDLIWKWVKNKI